MKSVLAVALCGLLCVAPLSALGQTEEVLDRARMPADGDPHAEVRLVRRGSTTVVETLVYSRVLRRVVAEIRDKEARNWPAGKAGHDDSAAYVAALEATANDVWLAFLQRDDRRERHQSLLIDFALSADGARVSFYRTRVRENGGGWEVLDRKLARTLEPKREYLRANMALIVADAFGGTSPAARRLDELVGSSTD